MSRWLYLLLIAAPLALILRAAGAGPLAVFVVAALGLIPLAGLIGVATEALAERVGPHHRRPAQRDLRQRGGDHHRPDGARCGSAGCGTRLAGGIDHRQFAAGARFGDGGRRLALSPSTLRRADGGTVCLDAGAGGGGHGDPSLLGTVGEGGATRPGCHPRRRVSPAQHWRLGDPAGLLCRLYCLLGLWRAATPGEHHAAQMSRSRRISGQWIRGVRRIQRTASTAWRVPRSAGAWRRRIGRRRSRRASPSLAYGIWLPHRGCWLP